MSKKSKINILAGVLMSFLMISLTLTNIGLASNYIDEDEASFLVFNRIEGTKLFNADMCFRQFCDPHLCSENRPGEEYVGCLSIVNKQLIDFEALNKKIEKSKSIYLSNHNAEYEELLEKKRIAGDDTRLIIESENSYYLRIFISAYSAELKGVDAKRLNTAIPFARYRPHDDGLNLLLEPEVEPIDYPSFKERFNTLLSMSAQELVTSLEWHMYLEKQEQEE